MAVKPIPQGYHTVTPYLCVRDCAKAIDFYKRALGAAEISRMSGPGGGVMHAEIKIGDSRIMMSDEFPQSGVKSPQSLGATTTQLHIYVEDCDKVFQQAVSAGCKADMPPTDMFWGDRYGKLTDPFGHAWGVATHKEDVSKEEMERRGREFAAKMQQQQTKSAS